MGYAYRLTQKAGQPDKKLARHLLKGTEPAIQAMSGMGKSFSMYIRVTPHIMGLLAELREKPPVPLADPGGDKTALPFAGTAEMTLDASASTIPAGLRATYHWDFGDGQKADGKVVKHAYAKAGKHLATLTVSTSDGDSDTQPFTVSVPPLWLVTADKKAVALIEAESIVEQGGGKVESPERVACSGKMITKWAAAGQWVEWKITAPADGRYLLAFKYCTADDDTRRTISLDGAPAGELAFPKTGGFSTNQDNWRHLALGGDEKPTLLP
ncbi:MAG: PKD domain-containing protein, partial [Planctomycetes bacterium]|nr:PKD domain-containing protein [Planctomycetota bacterium]